MPRTFDGLAEMRRRVIGDDPFSGKAFRDVSLGSGARFGVGCPFVPSPLCAHQGEVTICPMGHVRAQGPGYVS
jgi:hypothetical protein